MTKRGISIPPGLETIVRDLHELALVARGGRHWDHLVRAQRAPWPRSEANRRSDGACCERVHRVQHRTADPAPADTGHRHRTSPLNECSSIASEHRTHFFWGDSEASLFLPAHTTTRRDSQVALPALPSFQRQIRKSSKLRPPCGRFAILRCDLPVRNFGGK